MALIKCKECGKEISDQAKVCPNCGRTRAPKGDKILYFVGTLIIALIVGIGMLYFLTR